MKKLNELIYNQEQLVKYLEEATTREDKGFYLLSIYEMEEEIEKTRKELGLS